MLAAGFAGFDTPASFLTFNRALAAKNDIYIAFRNFAASGAIDAGALTAASDALAASFLTEDEGQLDAPIDQFRERQQQHQRERGL